MKPKLLSACLVSFLLHAPAFGANAIWITNVKLVSPEKLDRVEAGSVLIENGRIAAVERGAKRRMPAGARRVDGRGYYLTPGLIDSHVHLHAVPGMSFDQAKEKTAMAASYFAQLPRSFLYYGYTTVVDLALADRSVSDRFMQAPLHPGVVHCAPLVFANGYPMSWVESPKRFKEFGNFIYDPQQAASIPPEYRPEDHTPAAGAALAKAGGAACVKTHFERGFGAQRNLPVMSPAVFAEVRAAATGNKLAVVMHANSFEGQAFAVAGNADVIAHGLWHWGSLGKGAAGLPPEIRALLDQIVEKRTGYQATLQVLYGLRAYFDPAYLQHPGVRKVVPKALADWFETPEGKWFAQEVSEGESDAEVLQGFEKILRGLRQVVAYLAARDANFLFASDTPSSPTYGNLPGLNGYLEMQRLHEAGLSLSQLFKAATINNARAFGQEANLGSIETGKAANLLLMKRSPLQDIAAYDSIVTVWVGGKQVSRARLAAGN